MPRFNICILFSDTGAGHRSAAEGIAAAIREFVATRESGVQVNILLENVVEKSHSLSRWFVELYNYLLCHQQTQMKYYYSLIQALRPDSSDLIYRAIAPYAKKLFEIYEPSVVVSVHPMINYSLVRTMRNLGLLHRTRLITVVTDPNENLWKGWACPDCDLTIVPNDLARRRLISLGVSPGRIKIMGMPIHPDFLQPSSLTREEFLSGLGLNRDKLTICINSGWAGGGNMLKAYRSLTAVRRPIQIVFLCGQNRHLFREAQQEAKKSRIATAVLPFYHRMSELMSACDLMVTKAGGLTTFEALARRLPLAIDLITEAMPQERGTAELLMEQKLATAIRDPADIVPIVESLVRIKDRESQPLPNIHYLDRLDAVYGIALTVLTACRPVHDLVVQQASDRPREIVGGTSSVKAGDASHVA